MCRLPIYDARITVSGGFWSFFFLAFSREDFGGHGKGARGHTSNLLPSKPPSDYGHHDLLGSSRDDSRRLTEQQRHGTGDWEAHSTWELLTASSGVRGVRT